MDADPSAADNQDEALVAELHRRSVRHLVRLWPGIIYPPLASVELISALADHRQARFRGALILLFLRRPSLSSAALAARRSLAGSAANTLRLYYQAAAYLQPAVEDDLQRYSDDVVVLPDLFSAELDLPVPGTVSVTVALAVLGERHTSLSGRAYNWTGSYRQHLPLFLKQLKRPVHADITA